MTWLAWLAVAVVFAAFAAVTGIKPKGTRPVARTQLVGIARIVLLLIVGILVYIAYRSRVGV